MKKAFPKKGIMVEPEVDSNVKGKYVLSIVSSGGKSFKSSTDSIEDSLLSYKPELIKGKTIINVSFKAKTIEKVIFVPQARRLFYNTLSTRVFARNIERALQQND